jgi:hypothetical protein
VRPQSLLNKRVPFRISEVASMVHSIKVRYTPPHLVLVPLTSLPTTHTPCPCPPAPLLPYLKCTPKPASLLFLLTPPRRYHPYPRCALAVPVQQRKLESEQWLRRVEAAKVQAHPDNVVHLGAELDALVKEVETLMELATTLPIQTTQQLLQLKDVKISLGIQVVLVGRAHTRMEPAVITTFSAPAHVYVHAHM